MPSDTQSQSGTTQQKYTPVDSKFTDDQKVEIRSMILATLTGYDDIMLSLIHI